MLLKCVGEKCVDVADSIAEYMGIVSEYVVSYFSSQSVNNFWSQIANPFCSDYKHYVMLVVER